MPYPIKDYKAESVSMTRDLKKKKKFKFISWFENVQMKKFFPSVIMLLKEIELGDNRKSSVVIACSTKQLIQRGDLNCLMNWCKGRYVVSFDNDCVCSSTYPIWERDF